MVEVLGKEYAFWNAFELDRRFARSGDERGKKIKIEHADFITIKKLGPLRIGSGLRDGCWDCAHCCCCFYCLDGELLSFLFVLLFHFRFSALSR